VHASTGEQTHQLQNEKKSTISIYFDWVMFNSFFVCLPEGFYLMKSWKHSSQPEVKLQNSAPDPNEAPQKRRYIGSGEDSNII